MIEIKNKIDQTVYQQIKIQKQNIIIMNRSKSSSVFYTSTYLDTVVQNQDNEQDNFIRDLISNRNQTLYTNCNDYNQKWIQLLDQKDTFPPSSHHVFPQPIKQLNKRSFYHRSNSGQFAYSQFLKQVTDSKDFKQADQYLPLQNQQISIGNDLDDFPEKQNHNKVHRNVLNSQNHNKNEQPTKNNKNEKKIKIGKKYLLTQKNELITTNNQQYILPSFIEPEIPSKNLNTKILQKHPSLRTNPSTPKNLQTLSVREQYEQRERNESIEEQYDRVDQNIVENKIRKQKSQEHRIEMIKAKSSEEISKREWVQLKMKARSLQNSVSILRKQKKLYAMKLLEYQIQMDKLAYQLQMLRAEAKNILCNNCNVNTISNISNTNNTNNNNSNSQLRQTFQASTNSYSCNSSCDYPVITIEQLQLLRQNLSEQKQAKQIAFKQRDVLIKELNETLCTHEAETSTLHNELRSAQSKLSQFQSEKLILFELQKQQTSRIETLVSNINGSEHQLKQISTFVRQIQQKLDESVSTSSSLQQQIGRLNKELYDLNQQCELLFDALQSVRHELDMEKSACLDLERTLKNKDKAIEEMTKDIDQYRNKLQDFAVDNEEVKIIFGRYEDRILQLQSIIRHKDESIQSLYENIDKLSISIEQIKIHQNSKVMMSEAENHNLVQQLNALEEKHMIHQKYLEEAYCLLKIPLNNPSYQRPSLYQEEPVLQEIQSLLQHNRYNCQVVGDYRQILDMFNISHRDQLYHEKLLLQMTQFRNSIGNLVKKLRIMEKKLSVLTDQNRKYVNIIKNGCSDSVRQLERLVQQQNQEIVKYRLHLQNISSSHHTEEF